jgi:type IV secretory pathway VirB10-like protein
MSVFLTASPLAADGGAAPHYYNAHRQQQHPSSSLAGSSIPSANGNRMTSQQQHQGRAPQQPAAKPLSPVASPPAPASEPLAAKSLPDHKQQQQQEDKPEEWIQLSPEEERHRRRQVDEAEGLSAFCSQHHTSEYNRLKWGDKGEGAHEAPRVWPALSCTDTHTFLYRGLHPPPP